MCSLFRCELHPILFFMWLSCSTLCLCLCPVPCALCPLPSAHCPLPSSGPYRIRPANSNDSTGQDAACPDIQQLASLSFERAGLPACQPASLSAASPPAASPAAPGLQPAACPLARSLARTHARTRRTPRPRVDATDPRVPTSFRATATSTTLGVRYEKEKSASLDRSLDRRSTPLTNPRLPSPFWPSVLAIRSGH